MSDATTTMVSSAVQAVGQDPHEWVDLSKLLDGQNIQLLLGIAVLTFILLRMRAVPDRYADVVPWVLGAVLGYWQGTSAGYSLTGYVVTWAVINGGAAWLVAQGAHAAIEKFLAIVRPDGAA